MLFPNELSVAQHHVGWMATPNQQRQIVGSWLVVFHGCQEIALLLDRVLLLVSSTLLGSNRPPSAVIQSYSFPFGRSASLTICFLPQSAILSDSQMPHSAVAFLLMLTSHPCDSSASQSGNNSSNSKCGFNVMKRLMFRL